MTGFYMKCNTGLKKGTGREKGFATFPRGLLKQSEHLSDVIF